MSNFTKAPLTLLACKKAVFNRMRSPGVRALGCGLTARPAVPRGFESGGRRTGPALVIFVIGLAKLEMAPTLHGVSASRLQWINDIRIL